MEDNTILLNDLTDQERLMFQTEFNAVRKDPLIGVLWTLFLGGLGAHHFYLGRKRRGVLYACFFWTCVPALVSLVEVFLMPGRIRTHNADATVEIVTKLKAIR